MRLVESVVGALEAGKSLEAAETAEATEVVVVRRCGDGSAELVEAI